MGGLIGFEEFVLGRKSVLERVVARLQEIQEHYETFYGEVSQIKEQELDQLEKLVHGRRSDLPGWLAQALAELGTEVEAEIDDRIEAGEAELRAARDGAEALRSQSHQEEQRIHHKNRTLDAHEERLKVRNADLLARVHGYNQRIREMGTGFGFLANLPAMNRLRQERRELDQEQADVAANIENLRARWATAEVDYTTAEGERQAEWERVSTVAAQLATKLQWLRESRQRMAYRTTLERAVTSRPATGVPATGVPATGASHGGAAADCGRCGYTNPAAALLCRVCGQRLGDDRPDLEGSLDEIAEAIKVHGTFSDGMKSCQEIIGLVRGLISGHVAFGESVADMLETERKYPVGTLEIDVPGESVAYGRIFDELLAALDGTEHMHPLDFGQYVDEQLAGRLSEDPIQTYFETMGQELSRCADAQW